MGGAGVVELAFYESVGIELFVRGRFESVDPRVLFLKIPKQNDPGNPSTMFIIKFDECLHPYLYDFQNFGAKRKTCRRRGYSSAKATLEPAAKLNEKLTIIHTSARITK